jgi:methylphosphotriester-DNA--protein-cysteine methyltransferase
MDMDDDACYRAIEARDRRFDWRLFVAVTTTAIYCRPFCPAPTPRRENVKFFPTAAAAQEAGFRPCLRCQPETAPELAFWCGSSNTVSRALGLIEAGGSKTGTSRPWRRGNSFSFCNENWRRRTTVGRRVPRTCRAMAALARLRRGPSLGYRAECLPHPIGADGSPTGYGGGVERKRWLFDHVGADFKNKHGTPTRDCWKQAP